MRAIRNHLSIRESRFDSLLIISEHHTQRVLETGSRNGTLTLVDHHTLLNEHLEYIETRLHWLSGADWCDPEQEAHYLFFILERFHLTHVIHYDYIDWRQMQDIDHRLDPIGGKLILLTSEYDSLRKRFFRENTNPHWRNYIRRFGSSETEILEFFVQRQNQYIELADRSVLKHQILPTDGQTVEKIAKQILKFAGLIDQ